MAIQHIRFKFKFGFNVEEEDDFSNIKLVKSTNIGAKYKVLYVLDYVPSGDLRDKKYLLSGNAQETFDNIINFAKVPKHDYLVMAYHACRTVKQPDAYVENAFEAFERRLLAVIDIWQPDKIIVFGQRPFRVLCQKECDMVKGAYHNLIGVPFKKTIAFGKETKKIGITMSIPIDKLFAGDEPSLALSGYIARNLINAHYGKLKYQIKRPELTIHYIDTMPRFKKFFALLKRQKIVSIDTEADNLYKINNRVLTIQFSFNKEEAFIIPICHMDSPFDREQMQYICDALKYYFEFVVVQCMIFVNAQYDLPLMRTQFGIRYYCSPVWDIFAGEMCFHKDTMVDTECGLINIVNLVNMPESDWPLVWSYNHERNEKELKPIINAFEHETNDDMYEIEYDGGLVRVTAKHKIWVVNKNAYIEAQHIETDDTLLTYYTYKAQPVVSHDSDFLTVTAKRKIDFDHIVYDLTIADNHNLFVCNKTTHEKNLILSKNCLDENLKYTQTVTGGYYYSLGNLSCQYGDFTYHEAKFGKSDRTTIGSVPLSKDVLFYCGSDTSIPFAIRELQLKRAADMGFTKYESLVGEQMSDVIHSLSTMEYNGYAVDIEYLFQLKFPDSPINKEIDILLQKFYASEAVQTLNQKMLKNMGIPTKALFGKATFAFSVRTKEHLYALFFDALGLKPLKKGKSGKGKIDKPFQSEYKDVPEVKLFTAYGKATKLRNAYVNQMVKFWIDDEDFRSDRRIRCRYNYLPVITGRVSASNPGLQQIPSRSELGKHIKRLFVAPRGKIFVKVDYRAHEVRGWGIISKDDEVAKAFKVGQDLIKKYKRNPSFDLLRRIGLDGDVHKVNSSYFFAKNIEDVNKEDRNAIKGIIFGLIYGMLISTLAKSIGQELKYTEQLVERFMKRFKLGGKWFSKVMAFATKHYWVESPVGRRRNLFGYLFGKSDKKLHEFVISRFDRQAKNSLVQGFGSDCMMIGIRAFCKLVWNYAVKHDYDPHIKPCVSVHDSLEVETDYAHLLLTLNYVELALTKKVKETVKRRHNFDMNSDLEIDYEMGVTTDKLSGWYGDLDELEIIAYKSMLMQNTIIANKKHSQDIGRKVKAEKEYSEAEIKFNMESIYNVDFMTDWMLIQARKHKPRFLNYTFCKKTILKRIEFNAIVGNLAQILASEDDKGKLVHANVLSGEATKKEYINLRKAVQAVMQIDTNAQIKRVRQVFETDSLAELLNALSYSDAHYDYTVHCDMHKGKPVCYAKTISNAT